MTYCISEPLLYMTWLECVAYIPRYSDDGSFSLPIHWLSPAHSYTLKLHENVKIQHLFFIYFHM